MVYGILPFVESEVVIVIVGLMIFVASFFLADRYCAALKPGIDARLANKKRLIRLLVTAAALAMFFSGVIVHNKYCPGSEYPTFINNYKI